MSREVVIVGAARTAVGAFNGAFAAIPAHQLGAAAVSAAMIAQFSRHGLQADHWITAIAPTGARVLA